MFPPRPPSGRRCWRPSAFTTSAELYRDVPEEMLLRDGLDLPEGMSELEVSRAMTGYGRPEHRLLRRSPGRRSL